MHHSARYQTDQTRNIPMENPPTSRLWIYSTQNKEEIPVICTKYTAPCTPYTTHRTMHGISTPSIRIAIKCCLIISYSYYKLQLVIKINADIVLSFEGVSAGATRYYVWIVYLET